ncbi:hypothetical protein JCM5296_000949 [Sporobolomyces johnsonii]
MPAANDLAFSRRACTYWVVDEILRDANVTDHLRTKKQPRKPASMSFFRKFFELQVAMLQHNAGLTDSHPYASGPINWPFLLSGISFWTGKNDERQQLAKRRGLTPIPTPVRNRLYNLGGFFLLAWLYYYLPFFTMSRQLFLHHYLPAHVLSAFVAGARAEVGTGMWIALAVVVAALLANFVFLAPLTYGEPGLTPEEVNRRRILSSWTLHFAK